MFSETAISDDGLLANPVYTFNASTNDYASRFKLVFVPKFVANGRIYINDVETRLGTSLQMIDMIGREAISIGNVSGNVSTMGMSPGIYVLRLNDGNTIRTQKIVIE